MNTTANDIEKLLKLAEDTLCEYSESAERLDAKRELLRQLRSLARNVLRDEAPRAAPFVSYSRPKYVPKWLKRDGCGEPKTMRDTTGETGDCDTNCDTGPNTENVTPKKGAQRDTRDTHDTNGDKRNSIGGSSNSTTGAARSVEGNTPTNTDSGSPMSFTDRQLRDRQLLKRFTGTQKQSPEVEVTAGWVRPAVLKPGVKLGLQPRAVAVMNRQPSPEEPKPARREVRLRQARCRGTK